MVSRAISNKKIGQGRLRWARRPVESVFGRFRFGSAPYSATPTGLPGKDPGASFPTFVTVKTGQGRLRWARRPVESVFSTFSLRVSRRQAQVMVCKTKQGGRLVRVETRIAHGSSKRVARELSRLGFSQANTSTIERRNGTARGMDATSVRKGLAFAKTADPANPSLTRRVLGAWGVLVYNWARECRSLKRLLPQPQGRQLYERRSPAMAAGLIQRIRSSDRIWSVRELQGRIRWIRSPTYPSGEQR